MRQGFFLVWLSHNLIRLKLVSVSQSVMPNSLQPHGLQPTRLLYPWDFLGKNAGVGCHFLLQCMKVKVKSLRCVQLFATPWTAAHQAPPSMGFSRQEYWSGVPSPSPGEGYGNLLQCSCLENPRDRGAWWAAVCGVAQSRTRLKRFNSSSSI